MPRYIIWIDIGEKWGIAVYDTTKWKWCHLSSPSFKNLTVRTNVIKDVLDSKKKQKKVKNINWMEVRDFLNPLFRTDSVIIIWEAMWMRSTVKLHSKFYWVIELLAEERNIPVVYVTDNTVRKIVLWKGNGRKKEMIHEKYQAETEDISDAMSFVDWFLLTTNLNL